MQDPFTKYAHFVSKTQHSEPLVFGSTLQMDMCMFILSFCVHFHFISNILLMRNIKWIGQQAMPIWVLSKFKMELTQKHNKY